MKADEKWKLCVPDSRYGTCQRSTLGDGCEHTSMQVSGAVSNDGVGGEKMNDVEGGTTCATASGANADMMVTEG